MHRDSPRVRDGGASMLDGFFHLLEGARLDLACPLTRDPNSSSSSSSFIDNSARRRATKMRRSRLQSKQRISA
jgi:hypothetical protein